MSAKRKKRKKRIKQRQQEALQIEKSKRRTIRHNTAANQEKHRADWQPLTPGNDGFVADRRIMPRDELDRRAQTETLAALMVDADIGDDDWQQIAAASPHELGVVVEVSRGLCRVEAGNEIIVCDVRGILTAEGTGYTNIAAVGDRVLLSRHEGERGLIQQVLPRRSGLARADRFNSHLRQMLAANVDQVVVIASWRDPHIWLRMIDEYLIGAARNNLEAILCINKIESGSHDGGRSRRSRSPLSGSGLCGHLLSAPVTGTGVAALPRSIGGAYDGAGRVIRRGQINAAQCRFPRISTAHQHRQRQAARRAAYNQPGNHAASAVRWIRHRHARHSRYGRRVGLPAWTNYWAIIRTWLNMPLSAVLATARVRSKNFGCAVNKL